MKRYSQEWKDQISKSCSKKAKELWATGKMTGRTGHPASAEHKSKLSAKFKVLRQQKFVVGKIVPGQRLKAWLLKDGVKTDNCEVCGIGAVWQGKPITLELDHISGDRLDNRLCNLRIICPNCHSQTDTYKWKNSKTSKGYSVSIRTTLS